MVGEGEGGLSNSPTPQKNLPSKNPTLFGLNESEQVGLGSEHILKSDFQFLQILSEVFTYFLKYAHTVKESFLRN